MVVLQSRGKDSNSCKKIYEARISEWNIRETLNLLIDADSITIAIKRRKNLKRGTLIFIFFWSQNFFLERV